MTTRKHVAVVILAIAICAAGSGCSREQRDWRSAQAADSLEAYDQFIERHPDSELASQARTRLAQLTEERDWQRASTADTADAYKQFLNQHANGKWSQEARIRAENFSLEGQSINAASSSQSVEDETPAPRASQTPRAPQARADQTASVTAAPMAAAGANAQSHADSTDSNFGIQLGAFGSESKANAEWQRLKGLFPSELGSLQPHVVSATTSVGMLFRLQSRVENESKARSICASLTQKSQGCVVVLPQH